MSDSNPPSKRRFYHNLLDAYRLSARTYPALPWILLGTAAAIIAAIHRLEREYRTALFLLGCRDNAALRDNHALLLSP